MIKTAYNKKRYLMQCLRQLTIQFIKERFNAVIKTAYNIKKSFNAVFKTANNIKKSFNAVFMTAYNIKKEF